MPNCWLGVRFKGWQGRVDMKSNRKAENSLSVKRHQMSSSRPIQSYGRLIFHTQSEALYKTCPWFVQDRGILSKSPLRKPRDSTGAECSKTWGGHWESNRPSPERFPCAQRNNRDETGASIKMETNMKLPRVGQAERMIIIKTTPRRKGRVEWVYNHKGAQCLLVYMCDWCLEIKWNWNVPVENKNPFLSSMCCWLPSTMETINPTEQLHLASQNKGLQRVGGWRAISCRVNRTALLEGTRPRPKLGPQVPTRKVLFQFYFGF